MSRYANDSDTSNNRSGLFDQAEAPLPTYEEVVGSTDPPHHLQAGFKNDVLLPPSSTDQGHGSDDASNLESEGVRRTTSICKPSRTWTIIVLLGMILIPMCGMIIILQVKESAMEQTQIKHSVDKINASYIDCNDELAALQKDLDSNEIVIRDLRYQIEQLTKQRDFFRGIAYNKSSKVKVSPNIQ